MPVHPPQRDSTLRWRLVALFDLDAQASLHPFSRTEEGEGQMMLDGACMTERLAAQEHRLAATGLCR